MSELVILKDFLYSLDGIRPTTFLKNSDIGRVPLRIRDDVLGAGWIGYVDSSKPPKQEDLNGNLEEDPDKEIIDELMTIKAVDMDFVKDLILRGYDSIEALRKANVADLIKINNIGKKTAKKIISEINTK